MGLFCTPHLSPKVVVVAEERVQKSEEKLSEVSHSVEASQKQLSEPWLLDQENLKFLANYPGNQGYCYFLPSNILQSTVLRMYTEDQSSDSMRAWEHGSSDLNIAVTILAYRLICET